MEQLPENFSPEDFFSFLSLQIADSLSPRTREERFLLACLWDHSDRGHLCLHVESNLSLFAPYQKVLLDAIVNVRKILQTTYCAFLKEPVFSLTVPICVWKNALYLQRNWIFESIIVEKSRKLWKASSTNVASFCFSSHSTLTEKQKKALLHALHYRISLITGGPGTGKSYTILQIIDAFLYHYPKANIALSAPTGKAVYRLAKQLENNPSVVKKTLHALLGVSETKVFSTNAVCLPYDLVIIDECSMMDPFLLAQVLDRLSDKAHLVLVGDPNQLPSVDSGSVFHDLTQTCIKCAHLDQPKRFENQDLVRFASLLQNPSSSCFEEFFLKSSSVHFSPIRNAQHVDPYSICGSFLQKYLAAYEKIQNLEQAFAFLQTWQLLATHVKGVLSVDFWNEYLLEQIKSKRQAVLYIPIIANQNDYVKQLYNGMAGIWVQHLEDKEKDFLTFDAQKTKSFSAQNTLLIKKGQVSLAFCLSVHKSQGSEFDHVLFFLNESAEVFGKKIMYSAVTRAKKTLHVVGSHATFKKTLAQDSWKDAQIVSRLQQL